MPLLKSVATPNGANLGYHVASRLGSDLLGEHAVALLTVLSWPSEETYVLNDGKLASWEWTVPVPLAPLQVAGDLLNLCEEVLAALDGALHPFGGATRVPLVADIDGRKARKRAEIDQERERRIVLPFVFDGIEFDGDVASQRNIQGWQTQIANGVALPEGFTWRDAANIDHPADAAFVNGLGAAITTRGTLVYRQSWLLKAAVEAAATAEEVQAITWPDVQTPAQGASSPSEEEPIQ
jgi:hypothetical protein